jgi:hypothetical protein
MGWFGVPPGIVTSSAEVGTAFSTQFAAVPHAVVEFPDQVLVAAHVDVEVNASAMMAARMGRIRFIFIGFM